MPQTKIQINSHGQRILIIDDVIPANYHSQLHYRDFDAVYIDISLPSSMEVILKRINPITVNAAAYKPFFAARELQGRIGLCECMIDGYVSSIEDSEMHSTIDKVGFWKREFNVPMEFDNVNNHNRLILRGFRYFIARNHLVLEPQLIENSSMGVGFPLFELLHSWGLFHLKEYYAWLEMGNAKGWLKFRNTVYRTHKCPHCTHSHLIYLETCPTCGSNLLDYEPVIHHFPCANISPEQTYMVGGQLICPKCHKQLRHIGIDYDRPASVYKCQNCGKTVLQPDTKAMCTNCGTMSDVSELYPHDVHVIEITMDGTNVLTQGQHAFSPYNDYFNNYMPSEAFENRIEMISNRKLEGDVIKNLVVIQVWMTDIKGNIVNMPPKFIDAACRRLSTTKITSTANTLFIQYTVLEGDTDEMTQKDVAYIEDRLKILAVFLRPGMTIHMGFRTLGKSQKDDRRFLQTWRIMLPDSDIDISYDEVDHPEGVKPLDFVIQATSQERAGKDIDYLQRRKERDEQIKEELSGMQDRPLTTKIIGYLSWGFLALLAVAAVAALLGYYLFIK